MEPGQERDPRRERDHARLNIWVTFAGTVLAALIGGIFALIAAGEDKPSATPTPTRQSTAAPPAVATTTTAPSPVAPTGAAVRWSGTVVAQDFGLADAVDLDQRPPRSMDDTGRKADLSVGSLDATEADVGKAAFGVSAVARWTGDGTPELAGCRDAAAGGIDKVKGVTTGDVLCLRTSDERIARLTVGKINSREGTVTFEAVVWE
jgi:hypothetical protein